MASSRVMWICLLASICLISAIQSAPLNVEDEEDTNDIDFEGVVPIDDEVGGDDSKSDDLDEAVLDKEEDVIEEEKDSDADEEIEDSEEDEEIHKKEIDEEPEENEETSKDEIDDESDIVEEILKEIDEESEEEEEILGGDKDLSDEEIPKDDIDDEIIGKEDEDLEDDVPGYIKFYKKVKQFVKNLGK